MTEFLIAMGYCIFMLALAFLFKQYPPKKINSWYGYRTPRSMSGPEVWKDVNEFASQMMLKICFAGLFLPIAMYVIAPQHNILVTLLGHCVLILLVIPFTERYLDKRYDGQGNRK